MHKHCKYLIILTGLFGVSCADAPEYTGSVHECYDTGTPYVCPSDSLCCRGQCVVNSDENCGTCGKSCLENEICAQLPTREWACVCGANRNQCSLTCCSDGCVEISTNMHHCGMCENACPEGQICQSGICQCASNLTQCGDTCVDLSSNRNHCGNCATACPDADDMSLHLSDSSCVNAVCSFGCVDGYRNLDGDLSNGCETSIYECGNGIVDPDEECDQNAFGNQNCQSVLGVGYAGTLKCHQDCTFDTSSCTHTTDPTPIETTECGNGIAEDGEVCDQSDLREHTCAELMGTGYTGTLICSEDCRTFETDKCIAPVQVPVCGNGKLEGTESCDITEFRDSIQTCTAYNPQYISGNLECTQDCQISTTNCAECTSGGVECAGQVLKKCTGKTWETTECKGNTPICSLEEGKCIAEPITQTTYSTDFEWLPNATSTNTTYKAVYNMKDYTTTKDFDLTATGRIYLIQDNSTTSYAIDGKGIIIYTNSNPVSNIQVKSLKDGIGTIELDANVWGKSSGTLQITTSSSKVYNSVDKSIATGKPQHVVFEIDEKDATSFTLTSTGRLNIDNLEWTSGK